MQIFDKIVVTPTEPRTTQVLWIQPTDEGESFIKAFINGKWTLLSGDLSDYVTKEAFDSYKAQVASNYYTKTQVDSNLLLKMDTPEAPGTSGQILKLGNNGKAEWAAAPAGSVMDDEMSDVSENPVQNKVIKEYIDNSTPEDMARQSGYYGGMAVGAAENLIGKDISSVESYSTIINGADGTTTINEIKGKSLVWNQLYDNEVPTVTSGHKYIISEVNNGTRSKSISTSIAYTADSTERMCIDLTLMFGAGNEPSTVEEFEAMFPLPYYEYNEGEIISNATEKLDVTGFNQWDEDWEMGSLNDQTGQEASTFLSLFRSKDFIPVLHGVTYYTYTDFGTPTYLDIYCYNQNKEYIGKFVCGNRSFTFGTTDYSTTSTVTPSDTRVAFVRFRYYNANNNMGTKTNLNISDPSKNGTYEPYKHHEVGLNLATITGKLNGEGESVTIFPDGMHGVGNVYDYGKVDADGYIRSVVKTFRQADMGDLTWIKTISSGATIFYAELPLGAKKDNFAGVNSKYVSQTSSTYNVDKICRFYGSITNNFSRIAVRDDDFADAATFKSAMQGVPLIYELIEYKEYTLDTPIPLTFQAYHGGTIWQDPVAPESAPMNMNVTYALDAVGTINNLPMNYISAESMSAFLVQLGTAMNGTWTQTYNTETQKYEYSFTANS